MAGISPLPGSGRSSIEAALESAPLSSTRLRTSSPFSLVTPLFATPYGSIRWDAKHALARFVRSELAYASVEDIEREGLEVERALKKVGKIPLLIDLREATPRNDQSFEIAIAQFRRKLLGGGQRVAILVRTAMGALQVKRHMREDGLQVEVFTQEEEALAFLDLRPSERTVRPSQDRTGPLSQTRSQTGSRLRLGRVG